MSSDQPTRPQPPGLNIHTLCLFGFLVLALSFAYSVALPFLHTLIISTVLVIIFRCGRSSGAV